MARVVDFLEKCADDPDFEKDFDDHPRKAMKKFGLSDEQASLIQDGTTQKIKAHVLKELGGGATVILIKMRP